MLGFRPLVLTGALVAAGSLTLVAPTAPASSALPTCHGLIATVIGTAGDDKLQGTLLPDVVWLGAGDDSFTDLGGNDVVCGGPGKDSIDGGDGNDLIDGGSGKDTLAGSAGDDVIVGGAGGDTIAGGDGDDAIRAGGGVDYLIEGAGDDRIDAGAGSDYLTYAYWTRGIKVVGGSQAGTGTVTGAGTDTYVNAESVEATTFADRMIGTPGNDDFRGVTGGDRIRTGAGADFVIASGGRVNTGGGSDYVAVSGDTLVHLGADNDGVTLGPGPVTAYGDGGDDAFTVASRTSTARIDGGRGDAELTFFRLKRAVTVNLGRGVATWQGGGVRITAVHTVSGTGRADLLVGSADSDILKGGKGDDVIRGRGGNDILVGGGGSDSIAGGAGGDYCYGEVKTACEKGRRDS